MNDTPAILARLRTALHATDGDPRPDAVLPPEYAAVYDDSGLAQPHRASTQSHWVRWTHRVVVVSPTREGLRATVTKARDLLTGWRPRPEASPLVEQYAGPVIDGGPAGDVRLSQTLTYAHHSPRSDP